MRDYWHILTNWIDHHRGLTIGLVLAGLLGAMLLGGCSLLESRTESVLDPPKKVNMAGLKQEGVRIEALVNAWQAAQEEIQRQNLLRKQIIEGVAGIGTLAMGGALTPGVAIGALTQLALLLGAGGMGYDNRRLAKINTELKEIWIPPPNISVTGPSLDPHPAPEPS